MRSGTGSMLRGSCSSRVLPNMGPVGRPAPAAVSLKAAPTTTPAAVGALAALPMRLTYRTMCVREVIAEGGGMSNRAIGDAAGIPDQGQISKLPARLERHGPLENKRPSGKGEANAWKLTPAGLQVTRMVGMGTLKQGETA
jgi:hypothetical protein